MNIENDWDALLDVSGFDHLLSELFLSRKVHTTELLDKIFKGEAVLNWNTLKEMGTAIFLQDFLDVRNMMVMIIVLIALSCVLQNIGEIFTQNGIEQVAEYVMMLSMATILLKSFLFAGEILKTSATQIVECITLLVPSYLLTVGSVVGIGAATGFYQIILLAVTIVEQIIVNVVIPAVYVLALLVLVDNMVGGEHFAVFTQLLQKGIMLTLKVSFSVIAGVGMIENMVAPVMGTINRSLLQKTISVIPGIGDLSDSVTSMITGSAVLVKNTIGVFGMILLITICIVPICRIAMIAGGMKLASAIGSVLGKSRLAQCADQIGDGCFLLARIMFTIGVLFFLLLAMIAFSTNQII